MISNLLIGYVCTRKLKQNHLFGAKYGFLEEVGWFESIHVYWLSIEDILNGILDKTGKSALSFFGQERKKLKGSLW